MKTAMERLSPRERDVLALLAEGLEDKEIAEELGIACHTVRLHGIALRSKIGARNRVEAARWAWQHGISVPSGQCLSHATEDSRVRSNSRNSSQEYRKLAEPTYNWTPQTFEVVRRSRAQPHNAVTRDGRQIRVHHSGYGWAITEVAPERRTIGLDLDIWSACNWLNQHEARPTTA